MPNWCYGFVVVKGKPKNIMKFCKRFIWEEDRKEDSKKEGYFARSFTNMKWKDFKKNGVGKEEVSFGVDFAWSCWSCLFEGYPQDSKGKCVTLERALKQDDVEVTIDTEEEGMCFEETIDGDKNGVNYSSKEMPKIKCLKCGNEQSIPSNRLEELEDLECYNCGNYNCWKDEFKELVVEKLNKIREKK
jgi:ribosomal protein S27E